MSKHYKPFAEEANAKTEAGIDPAAKSAAETSIKPEANVENKANQNEKIAELETKLNEAESKVKEYWNKVLYIQAEQDNLQRRAEKSVADAHKYALERFIPDLLPIVDSLEKALETAHASDEVQALREGTKLTLDLLLKALQKAGVEVVDPTNAPFNPEFHQAMSMVPQEGVTTNTVIQVMQKGYLLNKRLVRPALVIVAK